MEESSLRLYVSQIRVTDAGVVEIPVLFLWYSSRTFLMEMMQLEEEKFLKSIYLLHL